MKRWNLSKNKLLLVDEEFLGIVPSDHGSINVNIKDSGVFRIPIPYIKKIEIEDLSHKMTVFFREESYELFGIFSVIMIVIATRIILQVRNNQQKHIFKKRQSRNAIGDFLRERK